MDVSFMIMLRLTVPVQLSTTVLSATAFSKATVLQVLSIPIRLAEDCIFRVVNV